ncbi:tryptophan synthase subunit alpha [Deferribacter autotrophicus]|uniref:tryptophan synthase n=1 Tax=Deferribacter autotrophicus TaxID=500465 RepID=A0A5A8F1E1_9BACT|nr:tryptophan synthase subunit alpha [Deferribacter autotrophicus]KAA0257089.1 tryptophan synthase subunit alpha [Deferribacter autotrophicus]
MKGVYIVLNYPDKESFRRIYDYLINSNLIDFIEIGYPFNDPVADGAVIAEAVEKVHDKVSYNDLKKILEISCNKKKYVMTYANVIYSYGIKEFSRDFTPFLDGLIIADLPNRMHTFFKERDFRIKITPFVTPASRLEDIESLKGSDADFIYYVGVKGTTGTFTDGNKSLNEEKVKLIKEVTGKKVVYGFGIRSRGDVERILKFADGVVIGTEIVKRQPNFEELKSFVEEVYQEL